MKAFILDAYGKGAKLRLADRPDPQPGPRDVLVRIHAAGLNVLDSKIRDGEFKPLLPYKPPLILGHDLAGVAESVGSAVTRFAPGDAVFSRPRDGRIGTLAERIAVDEDDLAHKPANLTMVEAAGLPLVALTAWQALVELGVVRPGAKVLVHAGSGGFGSVDVVAQGPGWRDEGRSLCVSEHRAERRSGTGSSQGDAGDSDVSRRVRDMVGRSIRDRIKAPAAPARWCLATGRRTGLRPKSFACSAHAKNGWGTSCLPRNQPLNQTSNRKWQLAARFACSESQRRLKIRPKSR